MRATKRVIELFFMLILVISCIEKICTNGATNSPECNQCQPNKIYTDGQCAIQGNQCPPGKIYIGGQCVIHGIDEDMGK